MKKLGFALAGLLLTMAAAHAADDCAVNYTRNACPGQEVEAFAKCDGKASCIKGAAATSAEECQAQALKACTNNRVNITKSKVITATWKGQALKSAGGDDDFCLKYPQRAEEFDQCEAQ